MDEKRISDACEVLGELADMAADPDSPTKDQVEMKFRLILTKFDLMLVSKQILAGDSIRDALRKAASGDIKLTDSPTLTTFRLLHAALMKPVPMEPPDKEGG